MKIKRKTEVTIQTERYLIVRKRKPDFFVACAECGATLSSPEEAALFLGKRTREIYREIENGTLYFTELVSGELLVCYHLPQQKKSEL